MHFSFFLHFLFFLPKHSLLSWWSFDDVFQITEIKKKPQTSEFVLKAILTYKWQFNCFPELSDSFVDMAV